MNVFRAFCALLLLTGAIKAQAVTIDWLEVGDPGNIPVVRTGGLSYASVDYTYFISATEVTNSQYTEFLNAVDPTGANPNLIFNALMASDARGGINLLPGNSDGGKYITRANMADKPVNFVSFFDSIRFANWMNNGQGASGTEYGAYDLSEPTPFRLSGATILLPTEDEWMKAAYYDPRTETEGGPPGDDHYWTFPTMSDSLPVMAAVDAAGNVTNGGPTIVNFGRGADWNGQDGNVSTVGSALATSYYGAFDMAGNVFERTETNTGTAPGSRIAAQGDWDNFITAAGMSYNSRYQTSETSENAVVGIRLVMMVPEPSRGILLLVSLISVSCLRKRPLPY